MTKKNAQIISGLGDGAVAPYVFLPGDPGGAGSRVQGVQGQVQGQPSKWKLRKFNFWPPVSMINNPMIGTFFDENYRDWKK